MQKFISLLSALIFSIFAGVDFALPKEDVFFYNPDTGVGDYFQPVLADNEIDYQALYRSAFGTTSDPAAMCDTTPYQDSRDTWRTVIGAHPELSGWSSDLYEPVRETVATADVDGDTIRYTLFEEANICAPTSGVIATSHYACDYGTTMTFIMSFFDGVTYNLTISGAKCWYCCAHKPTPEDGRYTATTQDSMRGKAMRAGDVLCVGATGTLVTITRTTS